MCDAAGAVDKQPAGGEQVCSGTDKESSEAGAESNRDSGYGPSTSTQRSSTTSSFSRGCFSAEGSHLSSGSETSSGRLAPGAPLQPTGEGPPLGPAGGQMGSAAVDSDHTSSEKSLDNSLQTALQKGAYQHVMSYVRKIFEWEKGRAGGVSSSSLPASSAEKEDSAEDSEPPARLEVVVSLRRGSVVSTSAGLTELLGYPAAMWSGRSFIDYVYPRDRPAFTDTINRIGVDGDGLIGDKGGSGQLFCRLRHYRGLKSVGFNVVSRSHVYRPFQVRILCQDVRLQQLSGEGPCILVVADLLQPAYKTTPEGVHPAFRSLVFSMRHTAQCRVDQYDPQGIALLGLLPQDIVGRSLVDFFHPEDLPAIKETYRKVSQRSGTPVRSRPYRLRAHNGCYVSLETDWSCFINPWSNRIEAVICKHRVIKAPKNINIFDEDEEAAADCADKVMLRNSHRVDIETILSKTLPAADSRAAQMSQRRRRLMLLMENLITDLEETVGQPATPDQEHSSVPGDVSPHTSERNSPAPVSVSLPNYVQLNYKETINRFFESHPKTTLGSSDESDWRPDSLGVAGPSSGLRTVAASLPGSGCGSAPLGGYHHRPLTQAVLDRHNADMEKNMRESLGPKKHSCHDSKCKLPKRNSCSEKKAADEFEQERRRAMMDTPAWPAPSVFWPPFSACQPGAAAPPGPGGWLGAPRQPRLVGPQPPQPPVAAARPPQPVYLGPVWRPPPLSAPERLSGAAAAAARKRPPPQWLSGPGGTSSGEQSGDCSTTSESLRKMNLDSDEEKVRGSDLTFSDSSLSSAPREAVAGWPSCSPGTSGGGGELADPQQTGQRKPVLMDPPWLSAVSGGCELTHQYQLPSRQLQHVLEQDRLALSRLTQPPALSEQLSQLYEELRAAGAPAVLNLEEGEPSSSGSSDEAGVALCKRTKRPRRVREYDRLSIMFEEDSPVPPPRVPASGQPEAVPAASG